MWVSQFTSSYNYFIYSINHEERPLRFVYPNTFLISHENGAQLIGVPLHYAEKDTRPHWVCIVQNTYFFRPLLEKTVSTISPSEWLFFKNRKTWSERFENLLEFVGSKYPSHFVKNLGGMLKINIHFEPAHIFAMNNPFLVHSFG